MGWIKDIWDIVTSSSEDDDEDDPYSDKNDTTITKPDGSWNPFSGWTSKDAITAAGALGSGALSYFGTAATNNLNANQAAQQMAFQERMSGTAYQRATADMKAAGLNPMLAYSQGGASSGPGASAKMENALGTGAQSALMAGQALAAIENTKAQTVATEAQANKTDAETTNIRSTTGMNEVRSALSEAEISRTHASARQITYQIELIEKQRDRISAEIRILEQDLRDKVATQSDRRELASLHADLAHNESLLQALQYRRESAEMPAYEARGRFAEQTGTLPHYVKLGAEGIGAVSSAVGALRRRPGRLLGKETSTHGGVRQETYDYER